MSRDIQFMRRALELAARARAEGEVPVGALLVREDQVIGEGWNRPIAASDPTAHAEMEALRAAAQALWNSYRLRGTTLYVTLEPCAMCAAAIVHARVRRLVFGAWDPRAGAAGSIAQRGAHAGLNHRVDVFGGVLARGMRRAAAGVLRAAALSLSGGARLVRRRRSATTRACPHTRGCRDKPWTLLDVAHRLPAARVAALRVACTSAPARAAAGERARPPRVRVLAGAWARTRASSTCPKPTL